MRKAIIIITIIAVLAVGLSANAQEETMDRFFLIPVVVGTYQRGPKYFISDDEFNPPDPIPPDWEPTPPDVTASWAAMDYGFVPVMLLVADVTQAQVDFLALQPDVYVFPVDLDTPVADPTIDDFFEDLNIPTDWLTPSTSYRELMRNTAGMFQFNQRYNGISDGHSIFDNADLSTRLRQMTDQEQIWFLATVESFGIDPDIINDNSQLRLLVRQAANIWEGQTFSLGWVTF